MTDPASTTSPPRYERPSLAAFAATLAFVLFFVVSLNGVGWSWIDLVDGLPHLWRLLTDAFPPSLDRIARVGEALLVTFQMALVGTVVGVLVSLPLAILAARSQTPSRVLYVLSRGVIALFRTVPDLVWALLFVVTVGLGPFAGTLALVIDTIGFCGRFFAEAMEEVDRGPQEALTALGATRTGTVFCAIIPAAMPSFINTSLFALEKATRSSVILGLVGAGGIGIELKVSMDMFEYAEAVTIILAIFALVLAVERVSTLMRQRVIQ